MSKNQVAPICLLVAWETTFHKRRVARFAVLEVTEAPAAGRSVLLRVLDHELNVRGCSGNERLSLAKYLVVFLRRHDAVVQCSNDRAIREWKPSFTIGADCWIVAQDGPYTVEVACLMGRRDPPPVAVSIGDLGNKGCRGLLIRMICGRRDSDDNASGCCECN